MPRNESLLAPHHSTLLRAGERAAGVAHDLRNALTFARLTLEREELTAGVTMPATRRALEEARALCVSFLADSEGRVSTRTDVRLRDLLERELDAVSLLEGTAVPIVLRCPRRLVARVDADALGRAVRNLTMNAVRASASGSMVRVRARAVGTLVCVVIDDRGRGLDAAELAAAMQPGKSTRGPGGGYGSVSVLDCVRELDARLVVRSTKGVGTRCRLWIPGRTDVASGESWRVDPDGERGPARTGRRTFRGVAGLESALRSSRPCEVLVHRSLPARELERLRAICAQASVPCRLEGLRRRA